MATQVFGGAHQGLRFAPQLQPAQRGFQFIAQLAQGRPGRSAIEQFTIAAAVDRAQAVDRAVDGKLALYRPLDVRAPVPAGNRRQAVAKPPGGLGSAIAYDGLPPCDRGDETVSLPIGAGGAHRSDDPPAGERAAQGDVEAEAVGRREDNGLLVQKSAGGADRRRHLAGFRRDHKPSDLSAREAGQGQDLPFVKFAVNAQPAPLRSRAVMQERVGDPGEGQLVTEQGAQGAGAEDKPGFTHSVSAPLSSASSSCANAARHLSPAASKAACQQAAMRA